MMCRHPLVGQSYCRPLMPLAYMCCRPARWWQEGNLGPLKSQCPGWCQMDAMLRPSAYVSPIVPRSLHSASLIHSLYLSLPPLSLSVSLFLSLLLSPLFSDTQMKAWMGNCCTPWADKGMGEKMTLDLPVLVRCKPHGQTYGTIHTRNPPSLPMLTHSGIDKALRERSCVGSSPHLCDSACKGAKGCKVEGAGRQGATSRTCGNGEAEETCPAHQHDCWGGQGSHFPAQVLEHEAPGKHQGHGSIPCPDGHVRQHTLQ
jgi:hypothetical protein